jgi:hypothetical protein
LVVFDNGFDAELTASSTFAPLSFFDIFTEITIDGGPESQAHLGRVTDRFTAEPGPVPEPMTALLLASGLAGLAARRRRQRTRRSPFNVSPTN